MNTKNRIKTVLTAMAIVAIAATPALADLAAGVTLDFNANDPASGVDGSNWNSLTADSSQDWDFGADVTLESVSSGRLITKAYHFTGGIADNTQGHWANFNENDDASWEFWLKPSDTGTLDDSQTLFESGGTGDGISFWYEPGTIGDNQGTVNFTIDNATVQSTVSAVIDTTEFSHITGVFDMNADGGSIDLMQIYVNGVLVDDNISATTTDDPVNDGDPTGLSDWTGTNGAGLGNDNGNVAQTAETGQYDGYMAVFRFWEVKALTAAEVEANFNVLGVGVPMNPSPDIGELVPLGNVDLGWTNADPNALVTSVYVDVWFGMDPDNLTQVVTAEENTTSKTVNASDPNTYYWRVDSYVNGSATGDPIEGPLWWFIAKEDTPPVVDAGVEMISWQDEPVQLDPDVVDDGKSLLTYYWTAPSDPDVVVVFSDPNTLAPTVTIGITKPFFVPFVGNGGFEDPVLANGSETFTYPVWAEADYSLWQYIWYYVDDNYTSIYNPTIAADGFEAPEGENVGVAYTYPGYDYALTQILAETLQASTRYDLSVQVGNSGVYNEGVSLDYRVELWTGGNVGDRSFLYGSGEQTIDPNGWETVNLTYACGPNHEQLGEPLEIRLIAESYADGHAVYFDDVILTIDGESGSFPPHTITLTLAVHDEDNPTPVEDTMTIDVYADECLAAIGAGLAPDAGDVNVDCMTNLKDIAEIAAAWFDVYLVTAPFEKP